MADEIFMDVAAVRKISDQFVEFSDNLNTINRNLELAIIALKAAAFVSFFSTYAYAQYLEQIQPTVQQYAELCAEMSGHLSTSVDAYERGDAAGATRFY